MRNVGICEEEKLLMLLEDFTECFQIPQTTVKKESSDLRNLSTVINMNISRTIHNIDPHLLIDKITPLQTFRSI